jgi:Protein of unknown function, DUF547
MFSGGRGMNYGFQQSGRAAAFVKAFPGLLFGLLFVVNVVVGKAHASVVEPDASGAVMARADGKLDAELAAFEPAADHVTRYIDYTAMDFALSHIVAKFGLSARIPIKQRMIDAGRIKVGIGGEAALEGNRVMFSYFSEEQVEALTRIRQALEKVGTEIDFALLSRDQQLAYWFNLHNFAMIEQIARHYPVRFPDEIQPDSSGLPLQDAKILTVKGVHLSLKDIRTKIVYRRWNTPMVLYGFFHGTVGGPGIRPQAFTGQNVNALLASSANEFVNSLRGVRQWASKVRVSYLYGQQEGFFPNPDYDLREHLYALADPEVKQDLDNGTIFIANNRFNRVADMMGGRSSLIGKVVSTEVSKVEYSNGYAGIASAGLGAPLGLNPDLVELRSALMTKWRILQLRGKIRRTNVTIGEDRDADGVKEE